MVTRYKSVCYPPSEAETSDTRHRTRQAGHFTSHLPVSWSAASVTWYSWSLWSEYGHKVKYRPVSVNE